MLDAVGSDVIALFDDLFEGVQIVDADYRYLYLNKTAARHGQRPREDLIGRRMADAYPGIEKTEMYRRLSVTLRERVPQHMLNEFTFPDGGRGWFDLRLNPVPQGALIFSVDVTEERRLTEAVRQAREDLSLTLECMADGVVTTDRDGVVRTVNPAAARVIGTPPGDAIGQRLDDLVQFLNQRTEEPVRHLVQRVLAEGLMIGLANSTLLVGPDGRRVPIASSGAAMRDREGRVRGAVLVIKDMTEEYRLQESLVRAQKVEALGALAGGVAHDINNLLTVIAGNTDVLLRDLVQDPAAREALEEVRRAGERSARLTRQLLTFSRRQPVAPRVLDLGDAVRNARSLIRSLAGEQIRIEEHLYGTTLAVRIDRGQLDQVLMNLVVNARDAMPDGGTLTIATEPSALAEGRHAALVVRDTGIGMDEETQASIFEPFFTTKGERGTGLGMATVAAIVKDAGGHIEVESALGHGTTFRVLLPRQDAPVQAPPPEPAHVQPGRGERVLLVDDDESVRSVTRRILDHLGYEVATAGAGREALDLIDEEYQPDVLITDVVLPGQDGVALAAAMLTRVPELRVLLLSGYSADVLERRGVDVRRVAFLQKPFAVEDLAGRLHRLLAPLSVD